MADSAPTEAPSQEPAPAVQDGAQETQEPSNVSELIQQWQQGLAQAPESEVDSEPKAKAPEVETSTEEAEATESVEDAEATGKDKDDLDAFVDELFADSPSETDEADVSDEDESLEIEELDPKSKANKRIRTLSARAKEAEAKTQNLEASVAELTEKTQKQAEVLKKAILKLQELSSPKAPQAPQSQEFDENDPAQRAFKHLEPLLEKKYGGKISALEQELQGYRERAQQAQKSQELAQLETQIRDEARTFRPQLFPGLPQDAYEDERLGTALDEFLMTRAVGTNRSMQEAAPEVREFVKEILRYGLRTSRERGKKLQSKPASPTIPAATAPTKETTKMPMYSREQLQAAGYDHTFQASRDGFKKLQGVEPAEGWA